MPSPIRVPIHHKLNSETTTTGEEDANDAIAAYLTPLLTKHERNQPPLVYEDLLESYEVAKAVAAPGSSRAQREVENLHDSQLQAYEAYARGELAKLAESQEYPSIEEGESMPAYIERFAQTVRDGNGTYQGWRVSNKIMEEVFWSKVKSGARKAYFTWKSQSIEKDKQGKAADQMTDGKVKAFEAAALGALVSKSESQDSEMANEEDEQDEEGDEIEEGGDMDDDDEAEDDEADDDDGDDDIEEDEAEAEARDIIGHTQEANDGDVPDGGLSVAAETGVNENDAPAVKTPMKTKKRRRLPNGPLKGGGTSTADGGKKQLAKKQNTGKGANGDTTTGGAGRGSAGGRGKGGTKNGKAGRGGGGGRGTRKRTRKKGAGAGGGGVA